MKYFALLVIFLFCQGGLMFSQVAVSTNGNGPDSSAILDLQSTSRGFLLPRMDTWQQKYIRNPALGLMVYNLDSNDIYVFTGQVWNALRNSASTLASWACNDVMQISHVAGEVAPVSKTTHYGTVQNIPGAISKCWITSNLGSDHQATAVNDATEASAGWYWQFNRKRGYKHDGTVITPAWTTITIVENYNWVSQNDPCAIELGTGWRIPTSTEWSNVITAGSWTNWNGPWNSPLKMHAAGNIWSEGDSLDGRGTIGFYWTGSQYSNSYGRRLRFEQSSCNLGQHFKTYARPVRCIREWLPPYQCGESFTINHVAGTVAPVNKTVNYQTVTNIPGETAKCWIAQNLGAAQQADSVNDSAEIPAGWYWQFNRSQGFKHDGTTRTPDTEWIMSIDENMNWILQNDPCNLLLGYNWRIPTFTEWNNVDVSGNWNDWNGPWNSDLKLHAAGYLEPSWGTLSSRGIYGLYWSSTQYDNTSSHHLTFTSEVTFLATDMKNFGFSLRCIKE